MLHPAHLERLLDLDLHLLDLERLLHVVEGAGLHRLDRRVASIRTRSSGSPRTTDAASSRSPGLEAALPPMRRSLTTTSKSRRAALDCRVAVRGFVDVVPGLGQRLRSPVAASRDRRRSECVPCTRLLPNRCLRCPPVRSGYRQRDPKGRVPVPARGPQVDAAIVRVDDLPHDGQAQTGTLRFRREERVEDPLAHVPRHSRAVVCELDD